MKKIIAVLIACVCLSPLAALTDVERYDIVIKTQTAQAPQEYDDAVYFTYKPAGRVRYVAAAFAHEQFAQRHVFTRNAEGVFFLFYQKPVPASGTVLRRLDYRFVVDGQWLPDPANPVRQNDAWGVQVSIFSFREGLDAHHDWASSAPAEGLVEFRYRREGSTPYSVSLVGSFNRWDPWLHVMEERSPGLFVIRLPLHKGTYRYGFMVDGQLLHDPLNQQIEVDGQGNLVSVLLVNRLPAGR